jgi:Protein of unknown function (DUF4058)
MNPFLENPDVWSTFHIQLLAAMADLLSAQVRPDYLVHIEALIERSATWKFATGGTASLWQLLSC